MRRTTPFRREQILAAAQRRFIACGYHGASTRSIEAAAGVARTVIHHHYRTKRTLFGAVVDANLTEFLTDIVAAFKLHPNDAHRAAAAVILNHRSLFHLLTLDRLELDGSKCRSARARLAMTAHEERFVDADDWATVVIEMSGWLASARCSPETLAHVLMLAAPSRSHAPDNVVVLRPMAKAS